MEDFVLTTTDAAKIMHEPRNTVIALTRLGILKAIKTPRAVLYRMADVEAIAEKLNRAKQVRIELNASE